MTHDKELQKKTCKCCKQEKSIKEFYKSKNNKDGYYTNCKSCHYQINQKNVHKWILNKYHEDPEFRQKMIDASTENMKKMLATDEGRKKHNEYCLEYYHKNKERILKQRQEKKQAQQD